MLSIGKLVAGQAKYYLDQAGSRVDVGQSVGDGIEDYYLGPQEARGTWIGAASRELGLEGPVEAAQLRSVVAGLDPHAGVPLRRTTSPARVGGFDLTFSAPKSVSVLFGLGDEETVAQVRAAHDIAAREALGHLERAAAAVRRGHGGAVVEEASGLVAAAFRHRTSRAGDPQLHTHVLVANLGRGLDGRWSALDARRLYAHARSASFVYQAVLRGELTARLGVEWSPVRKGIAEVAGVPSEVMRTFSRRRAEIDAALAERGTSGARAAEAAALATRRRKDPTVRPHDLRAQWRYRAGELGSGRAELESVLGRAPSLPTKSLRWDGVFRQLAGPLGLTRRTATFSRADVLQAMAETVPPGAPIDARTLEAAAERFLASGQAVALMPDSEARADAPTFRRRDGRLVPVAADRQRYSTSDQLALEQRLIARIMGSRDAGAGVAPRGAVSRALATRPTLSNEQRQAVEQLCLDGAQVAVIAGKAGTGKTYALAAAREAWQAAGHPVLGVAVARRAAAELRDGAGIQTTSVAALLGGVRDGRERLPVRCVLVVDEAGMVPTRTLSELLDAVEAANGKLVLVGDYRQLPELEAGGTFRALVNRGLAAELRENLRQAEVWERRALDHLREGRADEALELYGGNDRLRIEPSEAATRQRLVDDWWTLASGDGAVMIAHRRADVADLNVRARARMRESGKLAGPELRLPEADFAVGDVVVVKRNDARLGVNNGDRGRVVAVDPAGMSLTVRCGSRDVQLPPRFLLDRTNDGSPTLVHGYAITGHVAQGVTVEHALVLADEHITREWAYVALSRGRRSNHLYIADEADQSRLEFAPGEPTRPRAVDRLTARLRASSAQILAIDAGRPADETDEGRRAEAELRRLSGERRRLEQQRFGWWPARREQLDNVRRREAGARTTIERLTAERRHGDRAFDSEAEERAAQLANQIRERSNARDRGVGHER